MATKKAPRRKKVDPYLKAMARRIADQQALRAREVIEMRQALASGNQALALACKNAIKDVDTRIADIKRTIGAYKDQLAKERAYLARGREKPAKKPRKAKK